jgi:hypothetical protein
VMEFEQRQHTVDELAAPGPPQAPPAASVKLTVCEGLPQVRNNPLYHDIGWGHPELAIRHVWLLSLVQP